MTDNIKQAIELLEEIVKSNCQAPAEVPALYDSDGNLSVLRVVENMDKTQKALALLKQEPSDSEQIQQLEKDLSRITQCLEIAIESMEGCKHCWPKYKDGVEPIEESILSESGNS